MPKLTLRDLFAFVTIVALALGWAVDHWTNSESAVLEWRIRVLKSELERLGARVTISESGIATALPNGQGLMYFEREARPIVGP